MKSRELEIQGKAIGLAMLKGIMSSSLVIRIALLFFLPFVANAQIDVETNAPYNTAAYLVNNVLLGSGVVATNITYSGQAEQIGFFNGSASNIGIDSGLVMSSGNVLDIEPGGFGAGLPGAGGGDQDLLDIARSVTTNPSAAGISSVNDAAIIEFDFVPTGDTVQFNFVFASDEYTSWINSVYNDAFAFLLSGPGINGPYSSPGGFPNGSVNVAVVPGTNLPITISTIYDDPFQNPPQMNAQYYIDNSAGTSHSLNAFTTKITAVYQVQCGQTYHFKFAIGDCEDGTLDTGVFLEAGSFVSSGVSVSASSSLSDVTGDTLMLEGCGEMEFVYGRGGDLFAPDTIFISTSGSAVNGLDYDEIPDTVIFQPGQAIDTLTITALTDIFPEGIEDLQLQFMTNGGCLGNDTVVIPLYIQDVFPVVTQTKDTVLDYSLDCEMTVGVEVLSGIPSYSYLWSTGETTSNITVAPLTSTRYLVTVTDSCGTFAVVDSLVLDVIRNPVDAQVNDTSVICPGQPVDVTLNLSGGNPPYQITWGNGATDTLTQGLVALETTQFTVTITDQCGVDTTTVSPTVFVPEAPLLTAILSSYSVTISCPGEAVAVSGIAEGGYGQYQFSWTDWNSKGANMLEYPDSSTVYLFQVTDFCLQDTAEVEFSVVIPVTDTLKVELEYDTFMCKNEIITIAATVTGGATPYQFEWTGFGGKDSVIHVSPGETATYSLEVTDECEAVITTDATILLSEPDADFDVFYRTGNMIEFVDKSTEDVESYLWDLGNGEYAAAETFLYEFEEEGVRTVSLFVTNEHDCVDSTSQQLIPPFQLWAANSFTPNGDGLNDVFLPKGIGFFPESYSLVIYNRFGNRIFASTDPSEGWDGRGALNDVYAYKISVSGYDENGFEKEYFKLGSLTLIR